jgi:hypothetical protein
VLAVVMGPFCSGMGERYVGAGLLRHSVRPFQSRMDP